MPEKKPLFRPGTVDDHKELRELRRQLLVALVETGRPFAELLQFDRPEIVNVWRDVLAIIPGSYVGTFIDHIFVYNHLMSMAQARQLVQQLQALRRERTDKRREDAGLARGLLAEFRQVLEQVAAIEAADRAAEEESEGLDLDRRHASPVDRAYLKGQVDFFAQVARRNRRLRQDMEHIIKEVITQPAQIEETLNTEASAPSYFANMTLSYITRNLDTLSRFYAANSKEGQDKAMKALKQLRKHLINADASGFGDRARAVIRDRALADPGLHHYLFREPIPNQQRY